MQDEGMILSLNHIYCTTQNYTFSLIVPIFCALVITGIFFVEVMIYFNWYKARKEVNALFALQSGEFAAISKEYQHRGLSTSISVRVGLFTLYCITTLSACIVFVSNRASSFPYMVEGSLPLAAFLTLGTQKDLIQFWLCCRRRRKPSELSVDEKAIPSARTLSNSPSIESILASSTLTSFTFSPDSPREFMKSKNHSESGWDLGDDETMRRASEELV
ncbi:hypothetical protein M0805_003989 [Coniferiporia weirii]|nr:hypothetical protein M0805_003989 [Coniferiporia weirii]